MRRVVCVVLAAGCGRIGFDTPRPTSDAALVDSALVDSPDGLLPDAPVPTIDCADINLGSVIGPTVAMGTTSGLADDYAGCNGDGGHDITFGWFAPESGTYDISLCRSDPGWDSVLSVRDGSCAGPELACDDNSCGSGSAGLGADVRVGLQAGQGIVIIVDSKAGSDGTYDLSITHE